VLRSTKLQLKEPKLAKHKFATLLQAVNFLVQGISFGSPMASQQTNDSQDAVDFRLADDEPRKSAGQGNGLFARNMIIPCDSIYHLYSSNLISSFLLVF
jgi:hypothetical protein